MILRTAGFTPHEALAAGIGPEGAAVRFAARGRLAVVLRRLAASGGRNANMIVGATGLAPDEALAAGLRPKLRLDGRSEQKSGKTQGGKTERNEQPLQDHR